MPLPSPPPSAAGSPSQPAWYRLSRWFGGASASGAAAAAASVRAPINAEAEVERLRAQARRRLIGAVVLLAIGVIAFPLVFETEPRPMGVDTPMQRVPGSVGAAPTSAAPPRRVVQADAVPADPPPQNLPTPVAVQAPAATSPEAVDPPPSPALVQAPPAAIPAPAAAPAAVGPTEAERAQAERLQAQRAEAERAEAQRAEAQRARALLEGRSAASPLRPAAPAEPVAAARYVVQVGAFTEKRALAEARSRVERLGLKTYTQVIESPAGPRTRVRVGPFSSRAEADAAGAKLKAAGLPAAILTL